MSKNTKRYRRYEDYQTPHKRTPWYTNLLFVFELTSSLWAVFTFLKHLFKKKR